MPQKGPLIGLIKYLILFQVWKLAGMAWILAIAASLPMLYVFRINVSQLHDESVTKCENIFRDRPVSHRRAFLTFVAVVVFLIPIIILLFCYIRIFLKISRKAKEGQKSKNHPIKRGKVHLERSSTNTLPKAKIKTLKMTFVIVVAFLVCGIPYFVAEMIMSYGNHCLISQLLYGVLGALAAANSAANPFVFLLFNCKVCEQRDSPRSSQGSGASGVNHTSAVNHSSAVNHRMLYSLASRADYVGDSNAKRIYQVSVKYKWNAKMQNGVEMTTLR